ncbi:sulfite reductase subunit alpha [Andreprevotia sp. IGB-42]|uniref:sulfite reductase subunit alpha n=1 Tax=Andreprevotia sp. IGB-42 TaxID=2497473 RepID=UPI00191E292E|nr:sulfite reductase subunit alpha [Andreprevotia sp. IGB-42]
MSISLRSLVLPLFFLAAPSHAALGPAPARATGAALVGALYLLFCSWTTWQHRRKTRAVLPVAGDDAGAVLIAYASQTGYGEYLAAQTQLALQSAGVAAQPVSFAQLDGAMLAHFRRALFIVSTTGEGDAPDSAVHFVRHQMQATATLAGLEYGVLALGDSSYDHFCSFGRAVEGWLVHAHAQPLFDRVDVDNGDEGALRHWQQQLGLLAGSSDMVDWSAPHYRNWQLAERELFNPGSAGAATYRLALTSTDPAVHWQAGDIAEIGPRNPPAVVAALLAELGLAAATLLDDGTPMAAALADRLLPHDQAAIAALRGLAAGALLAALKPLAHREYSIASLPKDGKLELLVRQARHPDGRLGAGSGWLTECAPPGADIALRIRENRGFHPPASQVPLILIGNGTGIAGLYAHLKARAAAGNTRNWLIFGERNADADFYFRTELQQWQQQGVLARLDTAFSRDQPARIYVQDVLRAAAVEVSAWLADGAAIYVCGSATGMAPAVNAVLTGLLGDDGVADLIAAGRYRRDVY